MRSDQIGERERERTRSRTEVRPRPALVLSNAGSQQRDVVGVPHQLVPSSASRQASVARAMVTGPSASIVTRIAAPKRP